MPPPSPTTAHVAPYGLGENPYSGQRTPEGWPDRAGPPQQTNTNVAGESEMRRGGIVLVGLPT